MYTLLHECYSIVRKRTTVALSTFLFASLLLCMSQALFATTGGLDPNFGIGGIVTNPNRSFRNLIKQPDGKLVVCGSFVNALGNREFVVARYNTNGSPDNSFGGTGEVHTDFNGGINIATTLGIQSDGKIVVGGFHFNNMAGDFMLIAARYNIDGSLDNSFDTDGKISATNLTSTGGGYSLAIQSDDKVVIAGNYGMKRFNTNGSVDNTFGTAGVVTFDFNNLVTAITIQADGKIVGAGFGAGDFVVSRYNTNGSPDNSFDLDGKLTTDFGGGNDIAYAVTVQPDGKILVGGESRSNAIPVQFALARYNSNGALDGSFDGDGKLTTDFGQNYGNSPGSYGYTVNLQTDGKIVMTGGILDFAIARYNTNGSPDNSFDGDGKVLSNQGKNNNVFASVINGNKLYIAGSAPSGGLLAAFSLDDSSTPGLTYKYYEGSFATLPNFNALTPVKTGTSGNVDISVRNAGVNDNFAFIWEGYIIITTPGNYTFETVSDDGSKLYFNTPYSPTATALVNNDGLHAATSATGNVTIASAGVYPIAITFFEATGGESMQVYWSGPGITRQLIPNSSFTANGTPPSATSGLNYKYYEGAFTVLPNFSALTPVKTGTSPNTDISVRNAGVNDNFAFLWEGYINITTPGSYTFETVSDDGSKFYFNTTYSAGASALVSNDGLHAPTSATGTVAIPTAGSYPVAITFFEGTGGETMQLYWSGPGISRQLIPNNVFTTSATPPTPTSGINFKYYYGSFTALPNFSQLNPFKTGTSPNVDISVRDAGVNDNFAFLWEGYVIINTPGTYTFETVSDDGSKLYFNTQYSAGASALVNNDGLHAPTSATGTVNIPSAGTYPIAISYFEATGGESMQVYWTGPGFARQLIPNSALTTTGTPPSSSAGLNYRYYEGSYSVLPNFNALSPVKTGTTSNTDIGLRNAGVNDNFAFVWEGYIRLPTAGAYTFETVSDDGSKLYFNTTYSPGATALVNNDGLHAPASATGTVTMAAGSYPIAITYFEATGGETMQVYWTGPGIARQLIPNSAFSLTPSLSEPVSMSANQGGLPLTGDGAAGGFVIKQIYPNPFRESFAINFYNASTSGKISVDMVDVSGKVVYKHNFGSLSAGNTTLKIDGRAASAPGFYFVRMMVNGLPMKIIKMVKR